MNLRITTDLPYGSEFEEPDASLTNPDEDNSQPLKLQSGFGFYAYKTDDREGEGVTYVGEWLNF